MSFKYINPGYANLLDVDGGITIADATRSKTGVGFYQPTAYKGINISATPTDLYGKFDVYVYRDSDDKSADNFEIQISLGLNGVSFKKATNNFYLSGLVNNNSQIYLNASTWYPDTLKSKLNITMNAINTISFQAHACTDSSAKDGYLILYANGKEVGRAENYAVNFSYANPNVVVVYGTNSTGLIPAYFDYGNHHDRRWERRLYGKCRRTADSPIHRHSLAHCGLWRRLPNQRHRRHRQSRLSHGGGAVSLDGS